MRLLVGLVLPVAFQAVFALGLSVVCAQEQALSWHAEDRADRVSALIPGRRIPMPGPEGFLAEWTRAQVERWKQSSERGDTWSAATAYEQYVAAAPSDVDLRAYIPDHISPYGRVLGGAPIPEPTRSILSPKEARVLINYCPFCEKEHPNTEGVNANMFEWDPDNPFHAWTICCKQDLYEREADYPADYALRPNHIARFTHLDETVKQVPATIYTNSSGVKWELYIGPTIAHKRWTRTGDMATDWLGKFIETGNPLYVHKLAVLLDRVADVYYGLPPAYRNLVMPGKDGGPLTRREWESMPRPVRQDLGVDNKFYWNRRLPLSNCCWLHYYKEYIWVEPFARVRHHPTFKMYSTQKYGDPDALDRKIMRKLMREIALMFESIELKSDYQDGYYTELMMLGILLENDYLFDFTAAHQECVLYNHHYYDGMTAEGAPNYMAMLDGYYRHTVDAGGWLRFAPNFLEENPFFDVARRQWRELRTARGEPLEFGDQTMFAFNPPDGFGSAGMVKSGEVRPSMNWPGFGVGVLRVGGSGHRQEVSLMYDRMSIHGAADKLGIACWFDGVPIVRRGGYAAVARHVAIDKSRPEFKALLDMPYPKPMFGLSSDGSDENWMHPWTHSHMAQNTASVNELGTSPGWEDEGVGELITYKGGEAVGQIGASFQVLDSRDKESFARFAKNLRIAPFLLPEYRRALLAVEGPDGRPYVVDVFQIEGGRRHALFQSAWGDRVSQELPVVKSVWPNMAEYLSDDKGTPALPVSAGDLSKNYRRLEKVESLGLAPEVWSVTWRTDHAAYRPFTANGQVTPRAWPDDVGVARLRMIGVNQGGKATLLNAKGPWVAKITQPLPNGESAVGDVGFRDAWDYLIERRTKTDNPTRELFRSSFIHVLEGHRDDEASAIKSVNRLSVIGSGKRDDRVVALELVLASGHIDTIVYQPDVGELKLSNGVETDARYALLRRDTGGQVVEAHMVRGSYLRHGDYTAQSAGDLHGTIVDIVGDLTGTRRESALIIKPHGDDDAMQSLQGWIVGDALVGRQLIVRVSNDHNEAYTIGRVSRMEDGLVRVDLANHPPFASGWYQVNVLDADKGNRFTSSRNLMLGTGNHWWWGAKAWFPEKDKTYTIERTDIDRVTVDFADRVNLRDQGIVPGDWFVIYTIEPGLSVDVADSFAWRTGVDPILNASD